MLIHVAGTYFHVFEIPFLIFLISAIVGRIALQGMTIKTQNSKAVAFMLVVLILYICAILLSAIGAIQPSLVLRATLKWAEVFIIALLTFFYVNNRSQFQTVYWFLFSSAFVSILYVFYMIMTGEKAFF